MCFYLNSFSKEETIQVIVINSIDLGDIVAGFYKNQFDTEAIIKFEITSKNNHKIRISKLIMGEQPSLKFVTEWKVGTNSGLEDSFISGNVYTPINEKIYVTVRVVSVESLVNAYNGKYYFNPTIEIELID